MEKKPFHESVVDVINTITSIESLFPIGDLIIGTKIPKNHKNIKSTFLKKWDEVMEKTDHLYTDEVRAKVLDSLKIE